MQEQTAALLEAGGFRQYEISAWARPGKECKHNMNYWRYGDYLGIGAGAHGKVTLPASNEIRRMSKLRHPTAYLTALDHGNWCAEERSIDPEERKFEFFLNQLRLREGVNLNDFGPRTGLAPGDLENAINEAVSRDLLERRADRLLATELGWRFVNEIQGIFLPDEPPGQAAKSVAFGLNDQ
jgi:oxygen-independent coproporphyrinogen-3 oxidase